MAEEKNKLLEGIAYFEQIRQMMPEDRSTLEFLCIAYEQIGDQEKYRQALVSLAKVLVKERDFDSARKLLANIESHAEPEIKAIALKIQAMLTPMGGGSGSLPVGGSAKTVQRVSSGDRAAAIEAELALVKWLKTNKVVEKELCEKVGEQLRGLASAKGDFLISALSILESENPAVAESASACIADEAKVPPVSLELFDQVVFLAKELPEGLVKVRGAIPFGRIADDLLVALVNPMDENLKMEIVSQVDGKVHFFFVPPLSLGIVLNKIFPETNK